MVGGGVAPPVRQHQSVAVSPNPRPRSGRPSQLPFPDETPFRRDDLPDRGAPGAPASWGLRAAARIIDFVIVLLPANLLVSLVGTEVDGRVEAPTWALLVFPVTYMVYETVLISRTGQTLGKFLCRIKVVEWESGDLPTPAEAFVRAIVPGVFLFLYLVFPPLLLVPVLIYLTSIADTLYRGVHDKAAHTLVLAAPKAPRGTPPAED
jgi:uncharacterized RDD family membrane protein YckC